MLSPAKVTEGSNSTTAAGTGVFAGAARRGTEIEIEFDKTFRIEIGNAVAVSMEYNGQEYSNFGNRNVVRILNYEAQDGKLELVGR